MPLNFDNPCDPDHIRTLQDKIAYFTTHGDSETVKLFRSFLDEAERKCNIIVRTILQPTHKPHIHTMIGFDKVNIYPDGTMCLCIPEEKLPKIPKSPFSQSQLNFESRNQNRIIGEKEK